MTSEFKFDGDSNTILIDGYRSITRTASGTSGNGIFSIGKSSNWNSFNDDTNIFTTANLTIGSLGGLLKATAGVVGIASGGTDYEPPVTKGNLTSGTISAISISSGSGAVIGSGTSISINKASDSQDGYLGKNDWSTFSGKQNTLSPGSISETASSILTIINGNNSTVGPNVTVQVKKATVSQDGYVSKGDWNNFNTSYVNWASVNLYGFENMTATSISFNDSNYTFTITDGGSGWNYFRSGTKCSISGNKTVVLSGTPPAAGTYYIYIDDVAGTLTASTSGWTLEDTKVPVSILVWDNTRTPKYFLADERHTADFARRIHWSHHFTDGAELISGGTASSYVVNESTPAGDSDNTFGIADTVFSDESIKISSAALTKPNGSTLSYTALTRTSTSTYGWSSSEVPFIYTASGYINYNSGGTITQGTTGKFYNSYLLLTNFASSGRYMMLMGRSEFSTLSAALAENIAVFDFTGFPVAECVVAYKFVWATDSAYTTKGKCRLAETPQGIMKSVVSLLNSTVENPVQVLDDLADVIITTPALDQTLRYNGLYWVNSAGSTSSAGPGVEFFNSTPVINSRTSPSGLSQDGTSGNGIQTNTLSKTPVTTAEQTQSGQAVSDTRAYVAWLYNTALGRTAVDAGIWDFETYAIVSSTANARVTTLTRQIYQVVPVSSGTVTISGGGANSRTATITSGQFSGTYFSASATNTTASYLQTPSGIYQISAVANTNSATITVPTGYSNEGTVTFNVWNKLFGVTSIAITSTGTNYTLYSTTTTQPSFAIAVTDKLGQIGFVTSNNTTTITVTYNGTARTTHFSTPLSVHHNDLAGIQGGTGSGVTAEEYHLTNDQVTLATQYASTSQGGLLSQSNWNTFNGKEPAQTKGSISETTSGVLTIGSGSNSTVGPNVTIQVKKASSAQDGYLAKGDWTTFNNKEPVVTKGNLTSGTTSAISISSGSGSVIGSGTSISINKASASADGYLGKDNWTTFNNKQAALTFSTGLSGTTTITANLSAGVSGGQTAVGGTAASNSLTLSSTSHSTKGSILFGTSCYDEVNNRLGIGCTDPTQALEISANTSVYGAICSYNASPGPYLLLLGGRGTRAASTPVHTDDNLGTIYFCGVYQNNTPAGYAGAWIGCGAAENWSASAMGSYLTFFTTAKTTTARVERMRIIDSGNIGIGCTDPVQKLEVSADASVYQVISAYGTASASGLILYKGRGSRAAKTPVSSGDSLGNIYFGGVYQNGTAEYSSALISSYASESWSSSHVGAELRFYTVANATSSLLERVRITNDGILQVGLASGATGKINLLGTTSGVVSLTVAATAGTWTMTLPATGGTDTYGLTTNGSGVCSWTALAPVAGSSSIVTVGTVTSGTWSATAIAYNKGGTGLSTYPIKSIVLTGAGASLGTTTPATKETREVGTNKQVVDVLKFAVAGTNIVWWSFTLPDDYDGGAINAKIAYFTIATDGTNNIVFQIQASCSNDAEAIDQSLGTVQKLTTVVSGTANYLKIGSWSTGFTPSNTPAAGKQIFIKLFRDPSDGSDNTSLDVYVVNVRLEYQTNSWTC